MVDALYLILAAFSFGGGGFLGYKYGAYVERKATLVKQAAEQAAKMVRG